MYCLYNGEYGEHDLSNIDNIEAIIAIQNEAYPKKIGTIVEDYICEKIEYDWGRRDQRWTCRCIKCGSVIHQYHTKDWARSHGRSTRCSVCREEKNKQHRAEVEERKRIREEERRKAKEAKERRAEQRNDYSDPRWIGVRIGHAVTVGRNGKKFILLCDCGREVEKYPQQVFLKKRYADCGDEHCPYCIERMLNTGDTQKIVDAFEEKVEERFLDLGFEVERVGKTGDYGVDMIVTDRSGKKIAVQCKAYRKDKASVACVQEVFAGGRYYGLDHFAVISSSGFSPNSKNMASVLGVYLCENAELFDYDNYIKGDVPKFPEN